MRDATVVRSLAENDLAKTRALMPAKESCDLPRRPTLQKISSKQGKIACEKTVEKNVS
jgi:hypothetical protein